MKQEVFITIYPNRDAKENFSVLAFAPAADSDDKYDPLLIESALTNENYHAFYIEGNPEIRAYSSEPDNIKIPHLAIVIGLDNETKHISESKYEWHFMSRAKGILLLSNCHFKEDVEKFVTYDSYYVIERVV